MKRSRSVAVLVLIAGLAVTAPATLVAQSTNWTSVKALQRGTDLIVLRKRDDRVIGYVNAVTDDTLAVTSDVGSFIIGRDNIDKVYHAVPRDKMKHMNRGALVGGLLGLVAGMATAVATGPESESMPGLAIFLGGGLLGGGVGAIRAKGVDKGALIYSAK